MNRNFLARVGVAAGFTAIWLGAYALMMPHAFTGHGIEAKAAVSKKTLGSVVDAPEPRVIVFKVHNSEREAAVRDAARM